MPTCAAEEDGMSKRFGRNQKRKMKEYLQQQGEYIVWLEDELSRFTQPAMDLNSVNNDKRPLGLDDDR